MQWPTKPNRKIEMKLRFNGKAGVVCIFLFLTEILIALFVRDRIVRPYGGDVLVVLLIYYFFKTFLQIHPLYLSVGVLLFAYMVELAQYFRMVEVLGVQNNRVLSIVLGSSFSWGDILAYTLGAIICYLIERKR
jgi:hypothetical protein